MQITRHVMHERTLSNKMNNDRAGIAIGLAGFNDLGRSVNPKSDYLYTYLHQELIIRSLQLPHISVTAFSQTDLFLV